MKPETATAVAISLLLAGSVFCVGGRHVIDKQKAEAKAKADQAAARGPTSAPAPEKARPAVTPERPLAPPSDLEGMSKRLRGIFATFNEADRSRVLLDFLATFKPGDWRLAMDAWAEISEGAGGGIRGSEMFLYAWAETDSEAAMAWAKGRPTFMPTGVMKTWMVKDPEAALAYVQSLGNGHEEMPHKAMLFEAALESLTGDLPRLRQLLTKEIPEDWRAGLLKEANLQFTAIPPETLYEWAESFEAPLKGVVLSKIFGSLQGAEAKFAFAERYPQEIGPRGYGQIYQEWYAEDQAAATKSLEGLEPGPLRQGVVCGITHMLYLKGRLPEAIVLTKRWPEDVTDSFLADILDSSDPKLAPLVLAELPRLKNDALRLNRCEMVLESWFKSEPEIARKWLAENEVPEQIRKEFEGK